MILCGSRKHLYPPLRFLQIPRGSEGVAKDKFLKVQVFINRNWNFQRDGGVEIIFFFLYNTALFFKYLLGRVHYMYFLNFCRKQDNTCNFFVWKRPD